MPTDSAPMEPSQDPTSPKTDAPVASQSETLESNPIASSPVASNQVGVANTAVDVEATGDAPAPVDVEAPAAVVENAATPVVENAATPVVENADEPAGDSAGDSSQKKPIQRLQIGTQRASDTPLPAVPTVAPSTRTDANTDGSSSTGPIEILDPATQRKNYPPPNTRDQLSPELEEELEMALGNQSLDSLLEESTTSEIAVAELAPETQVTARVMKVHRGDVFVDLGGRSQGIIPLKQFTSKSGGKEIGHSAANQPHASAAGPAESGTSVSDSPEGTSPAGTISSDKVEEKTSAEQSKSTEEKASSADSLPTIGPEIGTQIEVIIVQFNTEQGLYEVSLPNVAVSVGNWDEVQDGQVVEVTITGSNKGGLECQVSGLRGFMPMGQISIYRVENAEQYVGQRMTCVVTEANRDRRNLVVSRRAIMERERREQRDKLLAELAPGQIRDGTVRSLQDFGAFIDLGGIDGLIHISQLSWDHIGHPREVLEVGQKVKVRVDKVNQEKGKIGLAYRDLGENPWTNVPTKYAIGSSVKGSVTKLMQFGAFVKLEPGVEGLIHISELGHGRVHRTGDVVSEGQDVEVKILSVDPEAQRIGLSLKAMLPPPEKPDKSMPDKEKSETAEESNRPRRKPDMNLKGGIGGPSGGEQFGLKW